MNRWYTPLQTQNAGFDETEQGKRELGGKHAGHRRIILMSVSTWKRTREVRLAADLPILPQPVNGGGAKPSHSTTVFALRQARP